MEREVLIVGGGLNGPALALALAAGGIASRVIDMAPRDTRLDPGFDGRAYALSLSSTQMLRALGLWKGIAGKAQPILDVKVSDGRAGEGAAPWVLHFDHAEIEEGPMGHMVEDRYLRHALLAALDAAPQITHEAPAEVTGQTCTPGLATLSLADGTTREGVLIICCDGRGSATAKRAGIARTGWDYEQTALVCAIAHERPHLGVAHQFFMPSGPLAILPLPDGDGAHRSSIVWTESRANAAEINALPDAEYLDALRARFGDFLGEIALAGRRFTYPLGLSLANQFTAPRLALAGDAAHGIHPLAGQGLNLGLRDVAALAEVLIEAHRRGEDIGAPDVLDRYASWRRFDTATLAVATDTINRVFSNDNPALRLGRDLALGAVNAVPALRRTLIREAAGLTGDQPRLTQGKPI